MKRFRWEKVKLRETTGEKDVQMEECAATLRKLSTCRQLISPAAEKHSVCLSMSVKAWNIKPVVSNLEVKKEKKWNSGELLCACFIQVVKLFMFFRTELCHMTSRVSSSGRLEFQHGLSLPIPQLESVCGGVCAAVRLCSGSSHFYAWEPPLLPGGKREGDAVHHDAGSSVISLNDNDDGS